MDIRGKFWRLKRYLQHYLSEEIVIKGFFTYKGEEHLLQNNNFGDDINYPLLHALTGKPIINESFVGLKHIDNLLCIGSIIESSGNNRSIIWGSGAIYGDRALTYIPKKVCAVRGLYTKNYLESQGIKCPDVFGDPALLLPYIYNPQVEKKYKIGIIPHYVDFDLPHVKEFRDSHPEILFISFRGYSSWEDVICQIKSCEYIISSSLHGLIVSDAYCIPNVRVVFSHNITGGDFKYKDYYSGVGRKYINPIDFTKIIDISMTKKILKEYDPISYNPKKLLESFPYPSKLSKTIKQLIKSC